MTGDAKGRAGKASLGNTTSMLGPPPWSFKPMGRLARIGAWLLAALLMLVMLYGVVGAVVPLLTFAFSTQTEATWTVWLGMGMVSAVCGAVAYAALLGYRRVRRRAVYTRQIMNCGDYPCYALHRSFFRSFESDGDRDPIWSPSSLSFVGMLGPHLGPIMLAVVGFNALALIAAAAGQPSFIVGGLGAAAIVWLYDRLGRRKQKIVITKRQLKSVRCDGPLLKLHLDPPPQPALKNIDLVFAPSTAVEFLTQFNQVFPGMLPSSYTDHLRK